MKEQSICIIGVYFGTYPAYMNLWLKSCEYNPSIDFIIFGDNKPDNMPDNVKHIYMTLEELKALADKKLGLNTALNYPYKCCDFKVVYGIIFEDYIKDYDFWGHCDFDLIFGDLRKFFNNGILNKYDKIFSLGHLSLYRNTKEVNERYKLKGSLTPYKKAFEEEKICAFDEIVGIYRIYQYNKLPMYKEKDFADISICYKRFKLALTTEFINHQAFYWMDGKAYRTYYKFGKAHTDEFAYIHFKKRKFNSTLNEEDLKGFYIGPGGFTKKTDTKIPDRETVDKINPYFPLTETKERFDYYGKWYIFYILERVRDKYIR